MSDVPRAVGERWPRDCECGCPYTVHTLYTLAERCSQCDCTDYHRSLFHWLLDLVGSS